MKKENATWGYGTMSKKTYVDSPILKRDYGSCFRSDNWGWWFCLSAFNVIFNVPSTATAIQLRFHKTAGRDRWKITKGRYAGWWNVEGEKEPLLQYVIEDTHVLLLRLLKKIDLRKTFYLQVFYWE